ncbi:MAG: glutathione S-transferase family protein [Myxococcales bacterium]|nr:glutathione S-transferase family protein [Myxococcales bacterium]
MTIAEPRHGLTLVGRRTSHFTRVVAIVADELGVEVERRSVRDLASQDCASYGGNPALKLPVLLTPTGAVYGTENICRALVRRAGGARKAFFTEDLTDERAQSAQELVWHAMSAQVQWVMGTRVCGLPSDNEYFVKCRLGLEGALKWLEAHLDAVLSTLPAGQGLSLFEVTLFCLIEHLAFRPTVPLEAYPGLTRFAHLYGERPACQRTPYPSEPILAPTSKEPPTC